MIKNIIFDCGEVLIKFDPLYIVNNIVPEIKEKSVLKKEIFETEVWQLLDKGVITNEEAYNTICERLPVSLHVCCKNILDNWYKYLDKIIENIDLMKKLKNNNYNIFILSNFNSDYYKMKENIEIGNLISGEIVSSEEKCLKPDKQIYLKLFNKYNLDPRESYFIDDKQENIETANQLGMKGFIFKENIEDLKKDLETNGINI